MQGQSEEGIWSTNIFGKSIEQIVDDGIQAKISQMTEDRQMKLQDTLQKIINDSNGGNDLHYYLISGILKPSVLAKINTVQEMVK